MKTISTVCLASIFAWLPLNLSKLIGPKPKPPTPVMQYLRLTTNPPPNLPPVGAVDIYFNQTQGAIMVRNAAGVSTPLGSGGGDITSDQITDASNDGLGAAGKVVLFADSGDGNGMLYSTGGLGTGGVCYGVTGIQYSGATIDISDTMSGTMAVGPSYVDNATAISEGGLTTGDLYYNSTDTKFTTVQAPYSPPMSDPVISVEVATARLVDGINDAMAALTDPVGRPDRLFSAYDHAAGAYTRNPDLWCKSLVGQLTGVAAVKYVPARPGVFAAYWEGARGGVMITKRHLLQCYHGRIDAEYGDVPVTWRFVTTGNVVVNRTAVCNAYIPGHAFVVTLLDSDVPSTVHITPLLSLDATAWGEVLNNWPPIVTAMGVSQQRGNFAPYLETRAHTAGVPSNFPYGDYPYEPVPGDSGTPRFWLVNGRLYLADITDAETVHNSTAWIQSLIDLADATAGIATGYTLRVYPNPYLNPEPEPST